MSKITFETTKEFLRFQVRPLLVHFIRDKKQSTYDFFIFPKELTEKLKERNAASLQPAEQNLSHIENIFKDTVDLKRMSNGFA